MFRFSFFMPVLRVEKGKKGTVSQEQGKGRGLLLAGGDL